MFLYHFGICGSFSRAFPEKKNKCLLSKHRCDLKSHIEDQIPCRYRVTIYVNFPHYISLSLTHGSLCTQGGAGGTPWGPGRFRWKLHPSSEAWPPISTSNRGETAIAKCPNWAVLNLCHKNQRLWLYYANEDFIIHDYVDGNFNGMYVIQESCQMPSVTQLSLADKMWCQTKVIIGSGYGILSNQPQTVSSTKGAVKSTEMSDISMNLWLVAACFVYGCVNVCHIWLSISINKQRIYI